MNKFVCVLAIGILMSSCATTGRSLGVNVKADVGAAGVGEAQPGVAHGGAYSAKGYKVVIVSQVLGGPPLPVSGIQVAAWDPTEATTKVEVTRADGSVFFQMRGAPTFWVLDADGRAVLIETAPQASDILPNQFIVVHRMIGESYE